MQYCSKKKKKIISEYFIHAVFFSNNIFPFHNYLKIYHNIKIQDPLKKGGREGGTF